MLTKKYKKSLSLKNCNLLFLFEYTWFQQYKSFTLILYDKEVHWPHCIHEKHFLAINKLEQSSLGKGRDPSWIPSLQVCFVLSLPHVGPVGHEHLKSLHTDRQTDRQRTTGYQKSSPELSAQVSPELEILSEYSTIRNETLKI